MSTRTSLPPDLVVEKLTAKTAAPPMFKVILLNDDYTPMEFVVHILEKFFGKNAEDAFRVMLQVHHEGKGVCGVYPFDIASSRVAQVAQYARARQHPLQCVLEPADDAWNTQKEAKRNTFWKAFLLVVTIAPRKA